MGISQFDFIHMVSGVGLSSLANEVIALPLTFIARLFIYELSFSVAVKWMYVNNSNCNLKPFKIYFAATSSSWMRGRVSDWHLSQPGFDPSYGKLVCLATLMSSDRTKQICLWMNIYIYCMIFFMWQQFLPTH